MPPPAWGPGAELGQSFLGPPVPSTGQTPILPTPDPRSPEHVGVCQEPGFGDTARASCRACPHVLSCTWELLGWQGERRGHVQVIKTQALAVTAEGLGPHWPHLSCSPEPRFPCLQHGLPVNAPSQGGLAAWGLLARPCRKGAGWCQATGTSGRPMSPEPWKEGAWGAPHPHHCPPHFSGVNPETGCAQQV